MQNYAPLTCGFNLAVKRRGLRTNLDLSRMTFPRILSALPTGSGESPSSARRHGAWDLVTSGLLRSPIPWDVRSR